MAYSPDKKNLNAEVDTATKNALKEQLLQRKHLQNDAVNAAIKVWLSLPVEAQAVLMHSPPEDILAYLTDHLLNAETLKALSTLDREGRIALIQEAKKAGQKASRKK